MVCIAGFVCRWYVCEFTEDIDFVSGRKAVSSAYKGSLSNQQSSTTAECSHHGDYLDVLACSVPWGFSQQMGSVNVDPI